MKRALLGTLLLATLFAAGATTTASAAASLGKSPAGEILVITTNLQEAFGQADVADTSDMEEYVRRLLDQVPYVPDVLLLQEVRRSTTSAVASLLRKQTGHRFVTIVKPGDPPWVEMDDRIIDRESGILINTTTMETKGTTGTIRTSYPRADAAPSERVRVRHHAFATVGELDGAARISVASTHYVQKSFLRTEQLADEYKRRWVLRTADVLQVQAGKWNASMAAIGGDFNATRGERDDQAEHSYSPWLTGITRSPYEYRDAVWEITKIGGPDFIMTTGNLVNAGLDQYYEAKAARRHGYFYSDHRFRWAVVAVPQSDQQK
ncbi:MAG TPA: endonuclease/exonuclease/phosphatase family protein [Actinomycetota bacterium]|nr:endonuclease/exonuclease/phosphatase family protein [Actinomycetota bacterium]